MRDFIWMLGIYSEQDCCAPINNHALDMRVGGKSYTNSIKNGRITPPKTLFEKYQIKANANNPEKPERDYFQKLDSKNQEALMLDMTTAAKKKKKYEQVIVSRIFNFAEAKNEFLTKVKPAFRELLKSKKELIPQISLKLFIAGHGEEYQKAGCLTASEISKLCYDFFSLKEHHLYTFLNLPKINDNSIIPETVLNHIEFDVCIGGLYSPFEQGPPLVQSVANSLANSLKTSKIHISFVKYPYGRDKNGTSNRTNDSLSSYEKDKISSMLFFIQHKLNKQHIYLVNGKIRYGTKHCCYGQITSDYIYREEAKLDSLLSLIVNSRNYFIENSKLEYWGKVLEYILDYNLKKLKGEIPYLKSILQRHDKNFHPYDAEWLNIGYFNNYYEYNEYGLLPNTQYPDNMLLDMWKNTLKKML